MKQPWKHLAVCPTCGLTVWVSDGARLDRVVGDWWVEAYPFDELNRTGQVFVPHACDPQTVAEFVQVRDDLVSLLKLRLAAGDLKWSTADLLNAGDDHELLHARFVEMLAKHALTRPCPKCQSAVGERCQNLTMRRTGEIGFTAQPHKERIDLPQVRDQRDVVDAKAALQTSANLMEQMRRGLAENQALTDLLAIFR